MRADKREAQSRVLVPVSPQAPRSLTTWIQACVRHTDHAIFLPVDFVIYRGFRQGNQLICFEIVAWDVQIISQDGPTYVRDEEKLLGNQLDSPNPLGDVATLHQ